MSSTCFWPDAVVRSIFTIGALGPFGLLWESMATVSNPVARTAAVKPAVPAQSSTNNADDKGRRLEHELITSQDVAVSVGCMFPTVHVMGTAA